MSHVLSEAPISRHPWETLDKAFRDEHAVERVTVSAWRVRQERDALGMRPSDLQHLVAAGRDLPREAVERSPRCRSSALTCGCSLDTSSGRSWLSSGLARICEIDHEGVRGELEGSVDSRDEVGEALGGG